MRTPTLSAILISTLFVTVISFGQMPDVMYFSDAVRVEKAGLVHTKQIMGDDVIAVWKRVAELDGDVAKLNIYIGKDEPGLRKRVDELIAKSWKTEKRPAITIVPTRLPNGALLAWDAVMAAGSSPKQNTEVEYRDDGSSVLPAGRDVLFVSGRAATGDLVEATAGTMKQLFEVLAHLGSKPGDVLQVKTFLRPMDDWKIAETAIKASFGNSQVPPIVFVEWNSKSRSTEIELIAAAPNKATTSETISYFTPPGDKASPVYSRVARIHSDEIIYLGGFTGSTADTPEAEVRSLYTHLEKAAQTAGADVRHLAKATYYVSDDAVSAALNALRPKFYDPKRPPAASKVQVPSVGVSGRGLLIDMVAAPVSPAARSER